MEAVFLKILNMSVNAGWLVLAVLAVRLILKKAPKAITVLLWALVGIRLLCPFTLESALSLLPSGETVPEQFLSAEAERITVHLSGQIDWTQPVIDSVTVPAPPTELPSDPSISLTALVALVWLAGVALMLLYAAFSYLRVRLSVREGMHLKDRLWLCDHIASPFILGIIRPKIYIPSSLEASDLEYVIAHENAHLKRRDHWWKPLGFLLLCIHWFNPLLWLGYIFLCRDIEFACDEAVLRQLGMESKKRYSEALLGCSISKKTLTACPLAFGEVGVKARIKSVLNYKKPALWIILAAVLACIAVAVCFLTDPKTKMPMMMDLTVRNLISSHHRSNEFAGRACSTEYELLGMKQRGRTTTLYLSALYQEYSLKDGELYVETGAHSPTVITLHQEDGLYTLKEYWEPRNGSDYGKDIRKKFPLHLWDEALYIEQYSPKLEKSCDEQAWEKLKYTPSTPSSEEIRPETLQQKYPEYFGLSTDKGLEVYVWQLASDSYRWVLCESKNMRYSWQELLERPTVSTEEICAIVASYGLPDSDISVCPIAMPHSSYAYTIDEAYRKSVEDLFFSGLHGLRENYGVTVETKLFDIDGDGIEERCTLSPGMTSGTFSFTLSVTENGVPEYHNTFSGSFHYLSFGKDPDGRDCLVAKTRGDESETDHFYFQVKDGNIQVYGRGCTFIHYGEQGIPYTPWQVTSDLDLAISRAVQLCHVTDKAGDRFSTVSYVLLEQEQLGAETNAYLMVMEMQYTLADGKPQRYSAAIFPTVVTFATEEGYALKAYDNGDKSLKALERFPSSAAAAAENQRAYGDALTDACDALADQLLQNASADGQWWEKYYRTMRTFLNRTV